MMSNSVSSRRPSVSYGEVSLPHLSTIETNDASTLRNILDVAPVAIQILDHEGIFIDCNAKTLELFQVESRESIIGRSATILSPPIQSDGRVSSETAQKMIQRAYSGETVHFRWDHQTVKKEVFPANVTLNLIQYEGKPCLMASIIDMTDQVRRINAMSALIRDSPFSILTVSPDIEITQFNPAYLAVTGYTREKATKLGFKNQNVLSRKGGTINDAITSKQTVRGTFVCNFGSGIKHLDYAYIPVLNLKQEVTQIYHLMVDQTDLVNKLTESDALIDKSPAGIFTMDPNGKILSTNAAFSEISQLSIQTITSMNAQDFTILSQTGPSSSEVIRSKKAGGGQLIVDFGTRRKILDYSFIPVLDTNDSVTKIITMYIDVTGVYKLVEYLEKSVQKVSEQIGFLAEGKTNFTTSVIPGDEYTKSAMESFITINRSLDMARKAIEKLVVDSVGVADAAAAGILSHRINPEIHQGDFRNVVEKLNATLDSVVVPTREAMRISEEYAQFNFAAHFSPHATIRGDWVPFQDALNKIGIEVSSILSLTNNQIIELMKNTEEANASIEEIAAGSEEITSIMGAIRKNAMQGDTATAQILSAMNDMIGVVSDVSAKADSVATLSHETNAFTKQGIELAQNSDKSMQAITQSSEHTGVIISDINEQMNEIGKIVKLISDIASQTNLLALNAAIEAARAGEAGRGFAVVAAEVKSLAQDSRKSAADIADLIAKLKEKAQSATNAISEAKIVVKDGNRTLMETVQAFNQIAEKIEIINSHITEVASATEEQAASVQEVTASMQEIATLTHTISNDTNTVSTASNESSAALNQINEVVTNIVSIIEGVSGEMSKFSVQ